MSLLTSYISPDIFLHIPPITSQQNRSNIIFFVPGNPGLIGFYHEFLSLLSTATTRQIIAGFSLGGFDVSTSPVAAPLSNIQHPHGRKSGQVFNLRDQVDLTYRRIFALAKSLHCSASSSSSSSAAAAETEVGESRQFNVTLIGHSIGAYIALEVIRLLHEDFQKLKAKFVKPQPTFIASSSPIVGDSVTSGSSSSNSGNGGGLINITAAILLTPTIVHIARSPNGCIVTPFLSSLPVFLPTAAQWGTWGLVKTLPRSMFTALVRRVTGMRGDKLRTTLEWLRSSGGVEQTVSMAGEEMAEVKGDGWGEEVWGARDEQGLEDENEGGERRWKAPKLVLYFAKKDHWVEDETREEIVRRRNGTQEGDDELRNTKTMDKWPRIEVDATGKLVHGWCLEQSSMVAERVTGWIEEIDRV